MVDLYTTEQEQVEAIRRWWDKNGRAVVAGIVLGLLAVFGWRSWVGYQQNQGEAASVAYQWLLGHSDEKPEALMARGHQIVGDYPATPYAALASLMMARIAMEQGDKDGATAHLRWVEENARLPEFKQLARLRLARVMLEQGQPQQALAVIDGADAGGFKAGFDEARGDIYLALKDREKARAAYSSALSGYDEVPDKQALVRMKLDDLAPAEVGAQ